MHTFILPFPPSINGMWRRVGNRTCLSKRGRQYRKDAIATLEQLALANMQLSGRLKVCMRLYPPCRRKRDVDNYPKSVFDALTHAGFWLDDEQVDMLQIVRGPVVKGGYIKLTIVEIEEE